MTEINAESIEINGVVVEHIETKYNPKPTNSLMTKTATLGLVVEKTPSAYFTEKHLENITFDKVDIADNTSKIYRYTISGTNIVLDEQKSEIFIPENFYNGETKIANKTTNIIVDKIPGKILLSRVFKTMTFQTESVVDVYFPNCNLTNVCEKCFYILGHSLNYKNIPPVNVGICEGLVLGKDFFDGKLKNIDYGNFSNAKKIFVYNGILPSELTSRKDRKEYVSQILGTQNVYFYNSLNDIYKITHDTTYEFEHKYKTIRVIEPGTINIDTISDGEEFVLELSEATGSFIISRNDAMSENILLKEVYLGEISITAIQDSTTRAFDRCNELEFVESSCLSDSLFRNCSKLSEIKIHSDIGRYCFENCGSLVDVDLSESANLLENSFHNCKGLASVKLGNNTIRIKMSTFENCSSLKNITLPDSLTHLGQRAFYYCGSLTSISIPSGVEALLTEAFDYCAKLKSVELNQELTSIGNYSLANCSSLTSISLPNGLESIGSNGFYNCTSLSFLTIPSTVTSLGSSAFSYCSNLKNVECYMLTNSGSYTTTRAHVESLIVNEDSQIITNLETMFGATASKGVLIYSGGNPVLDFSKINRSYVSIKPGESPSGTLSSVYSSQAANIKEIEFYGITALGTEVFKNCTGITTITIPSFVTSLGDGAFTGCTELNEIHLDAISEMTFTGTSQVKTGCVVYVYNINIDSAKAYFGDDCDYVELFENIYYKGLNHAIDFTYIPSTTVAILPDPEEPASGELSCYGTNLSSYIAKVVIDGPSSLNTINNSGLFYKCPRLTSVSLSTTVENIGTKTFSNCTKLASIDLPTSITCLNKSSFSKCSSLVNITIPQSLTSFGQSVFYECSSLTSISFPVGVERLEYGVIGRCQQLQSVYIPSTVTFINQSAFSLNKVLSSVTCLVVSNSEKWSPLGTPISTLTINRAAPDDVKAGLKKMFVVDSYIEIDV